MVESHGQRTKVESFPARSFHGAMPYACTSVNLPAIPIRCRSSIDRNVVVKATGVGRHIEAVPNHSLEQYKVRNASVPCIQLC